MRVMTHVCLYDSYVNESCHTQDHQLRLRWQSDASELTERDYLVEEYLDRCVAGCCSVLQCVVVCCSVLSVTTLSRSIFIGVLQCVTVCCSVLQSVAARCRVLRCVAVCCSVTHTHDTYAWHIHMTHTHMSLLCKSPVSEGQCTRAPCVIEREAIHTWHIHTCLFCKRALFHRANAQELPV